MSTNSDILDDFGRLVVKDVYDPQLLFFKQVLAGETPWGFKKEYSDVIRKLNEGDQQIIKDYIDQTITTTLFAFLAIFEEHPHYKIVCEKEGEQANLVEISEMLKAEPIIDNGWIARFSKEKNNHELR